ncbi:ImmA/IrrE family metallo-endopeptidase [Candidatus Poriferisodalis sp.]|uniref:ImmA/IrrE family metallo-endopeptidase n=1 Tax=Candidatus Poriferisodalis sp. TaxID=3101277 RepID=UPI003AF589C2
MNALRFDVEWLDGTGIKGPELAATFASLRIQADNAVLTRVDDKRARTLRDAVYVPLYPMAEWLVSNWWFLAYEAENLLNRTDRAFAQRHSLVTGAEGYAFPDVRFSSAGRLTHIVWSDRMSEWNELEFRSRGSITVDRDQFVQDCSDFVDMVVSRLAACGITATHLQSEWAAIEATDADELAFCATAAGLGRDPYDLDEPQKSLVLQVGELLGDLREEALPALGPDEPLAACTAIHKAMEQAVPNEVRLGASLLHSGDLPHHASRPWQAGYELARRARQVFGLNGELIATTAELAEAIGHDVATLNRATRPVQSLGALTSIDGVVRPRDSQTVSFGLRAAGETSQRFLFCRALAEALTTSNDALLTRANTERQQRNRAFAAEFLAPSASLAERITVQFVDQDLIADLADEFGVSSYVIGHQIENHGIAELVAA